MIFNLGGGVGSFISFGLNFHSNSGTVTDGTCMCFVYWETRSETLDSYIDSTRWRLYGHHAYARLILTCIHQWANCTPSFRVDSFHIPITTPQSYAPRRDFRRPTPFQGPEKYERGNKAGVPKLRYESYELENPTPCPSILHH